MLCYVSTHRDMHLFCFYPCFLYLRREYGVANVGKQELTVVKVSPHNDRIFAHGKPFLFNLLCFDLL